MDLASHDVETLKRLARRRRRTWAGVILGNLALVVVLVGGPWLRGRLRAEEARRSFGELAACLWNGTPHASQGLTLPADDLASYAVVARQTDWPRRCLEQTRFDLEPAFWLFPEVRVAESDVVRATRVVAEEIEAVEGRATVASRPRLAMLRLSAALTVYCEAADAYVGLEEPAITLGDARAVMPERVPLQAREDAELEVYAHADGVEMLALDARSINWVRVRGGRHDGRRMRRPTTVRATARDDNRSYLLWWTDPQRCAPDCARRAMGWARLDDSVVTLPDPTWVAAHPVSESAFVFHNNELRVVALGNEEPELRIFELDAESDDDTPAAPTTRIVLPGAQHPVLDAQSVWWTHEGRLWEHRDGVTEPRGPGEGWVQRVGEWVWVQSGELLHAGESVGTVPVEGRLVSDGPHAWLVWNDHGVLRARRCAEQCAATFEVATDVVGDWDVVARRDHALVAYTLEFGPAIVVTQIGTRHEEDFLTTCFDTDILTGEESGMCGTPTFGRRGERVFLVAREGTDAWVIEREAEGWKRLTGLR